MAWYELISLVLGYAAWTILIGNMLVLYADGEGERPPRAP